MNIIFMIYFGTNLLTTIKAYEVTEDPTDTSTQSSTEAMKQYVIGDSGDHKCPSGYKRLMNEEECLSDTLKSKYNKNHAYRACFHIKGTGCGIWKDTIFFYDEATCGKSASNMDDIQPICKLHIAYATSELGSEKCPSGYDRLKNETECLSDVVKDDNDIVAAHSFRACFPIKGGGCGIWKEFDTIFFYDETTCGASATTSANVQSICKKSGGSQATSPTRSPTRSPTTPDAKNTVVVKIVDQTTKEKVNASKISKEIVSIVDHFTRLIHTTNNSQLTELTKVWCDYLKEDIELELQKDSTPIDTCIDVFLKENDNKPVLQCGCDTETEDAAEVTLPDPHMSSVNWGIGILSVAGLCMFYMVYKWGQIHKQKEA